MSPKLLVLVALLTACKKSPRKGAHYDIHDKCVEHDGKYGDISFCLGYYTKDLTICTDDGCLVVPVGHR